MPVIPTGFVPDRLRQSMQRNRMTATALAHAIGGVDNMISRYLNGQAVPRPDTLVLIAETLHEPFEFFLRPMPPNVNAGSAAFMRSYAAATKRARLSAGTLKERTREVVTYLEHYVDFPQANFPDFRLGDDPAAFTYDDIERAANDTRTHWGLGGGPVANIVQLLEHHGAVVVRLDLGDATLNAFSQWGLPEERPYIVLGDGKKSAVRSRFDACHEIAHMVLHRHLDPDFLARPEVHKLIEKQANHFAGAFLLPAESFTRSVFLTTLSALKELKPIWGASIAAMIFRLTQLDLISERQARRLWEAYAPWRQGEPLDKETPMEQPASLRQSFSIVRDECGISAAQVAIDLPFSESEITAIGGLPMGFFREEPGRIRPKVKQSSGILEFRPRSS